MLPTSYFMADQFNQYLYGFGDGDTMCVCDNDLMIFFVLCTYVCVSDISNDSLLYNSLYQICFGQQHFPV